MSADPMRRPGSRTASHILGPVDQIPFGEGRAFGVDGEQVAVFRLRDGTLRALSAVCPHRGGPIADGTIDRQVVMCPLHQHAFSLETGLLHHRRRTFAHLQRPGGCRAEHCSAKSPEAWQ